jgi:hypothetical protein
MLSPHLHIAFPLPLRQEKIRNVKNELSALRSRLASLEKSLQSLIDEPENVAFMNLTLLGKKPDLYQLPLKPELGPCQVRTVLKIGVIRVSSWLAH